MLSHSVELEKRILTVHTSPLDTHREKFLPKPISLDGPVVRKFDFKSPGCQFESGLNPEKGQGKQRNFSNRKSVCICRQLESENTSGVQIYSCIYLFSFLVIWKPSRSFVMFVFHKWLTNLPFSDATSHLCKKSCGSIGPSVSQSVGPPSVRPSVRPSVLPYPPLLTIKASNQPFQASN